MGILKSKFNINLLIIIFVILLRLALSLLPSFEYDESAYRVWSARLVEKGPSQFYSAQFFTNNPLGGLYTFWFMGVLKSIFLPNLSYYSKGFDLLLKFPANIADIASGFIIYLLVKKKLSRSWAIAGFLMYVINPAIIFNSAVWGQYDGLSTLFLLIAAYVVATKKAPELSALAFATAWTIKPQAIFFAPVLMLFILITQKPLKWVTSTVAALLTLIILYLPFFPNNPISGIIYVNKNSTTLFDCTTCFAFNFWGIFGNWSSDLKLFLRIPLLYWGIFLSASTLLILFFSKPFLIKFKPPYFYFTAALVIFTFFTLLTRMHERYLFPFFAFFLLAAILLRSRFLIVFYFIMSILHTLNLYIPYTYYNNQLHITVFPSNNLSQYINYFSAVSALTLVFLYGYYLIKIIKNNQHTNS